MTEARRATRSGDGPAEPDGYQPELKRTLGSFQVFAISFAFISVAVGIFATYDVVLQRGGPVAAIIRDQLGPTAERIFLVGITLAFFGAGVAIMTACSRLVFAMSRDARFPAHRLMRRVNPRTHTPIPATLLTFVVGVVLMVALPGAALLKLIVASTILPAIIYGSTIVLYLVVRKRLDRQEGAFNLGRFELPVAICALAWVVCALFVLTVPAEAQVPDLIVIGIVVAGGLYILSLLIFRPQALEAGRQSPVRTAEEGDGV